MCVAIGVIGSIYAIFGGLKAVALSDTVNGVGLLIGGLLIDPHPSASSAAATSPSIQDFITNVSGGEVQRGQSGRTPCLR